MEVIINRKAEKKLRQGYPLIQKEDLQIVPHPFPVDWLTFVTIDKQKIATGYLGEQNKGIGWLLNWSGEVDTAFFIQKFQQARNKRKKFERDEATTAYRLFNSEGDGIGGLTIDYYNQYVVFSWYNATLYTHRTEVINAFQQCYPEIKGIYEKIRFTNHLLPESAFVYGITAPEPLIIQENGINFAVYLNEGLMTGIFLDQKMVRKSLLDGFARGKKVLNMFSYTGAFSVASAMGGAKSTTSVDLAKRSLVKTKEQFENNHLSADNQKIIVMDVFEYFNYAVRKKLMYDLIILDPPSFARNNKKVFSVAKDYGELVKKAVDCLEINGWLLASTNAANLSLEKYQKLITNALNEKNVSYEITDTYRLPEDFPVSTTFAEGNYLKVFFIHIQKDK